MKIEKTEISKLNPAKYNPRKDLKPGDAEYEKLKRSIEEFGYIEPIIWNEKTGNIIGGHQRYKVLKSLGYTEIDAVVLNIDDNREKALNVALNKISGEFDVPLLTDLLKDLNAHDFDVSLTGFDAAEIDDLFKSVTIENTHEDNFDVNKAMDEIDKPISKLGDIWCLGKHKLMCGDSTSQIDVDRLMENEKAKCVFTDPPWNVDYGGRAHPSYKKRSILNDSTTTEKFAKFLTAAFERMRDVLIPGAMVYVVMSAQEWGKLPLIMDNPLTLKIRSGCEGGGNGPLIQKNISATLSCNNDQTLFEPNCYCISGNSIGREDKNGPNGTGVIEENSYTLNTVDRHGVFYSSSFGGYSKTKM